jgi:hypothetical protein
MPLRSIQCRDERAILDADAGAFSRMSAAQGVVVTQ